MRVQDVIRGKKSEITVFDWGSGKIPKARFPLSKAGKRAWSFGPSWQWRFVEFSCEGRRFVVRLMLNLDKAKASAHLAMWSGRDLIVLCCYEYHVDHFTGWHIHTLCGERNDVDSAPAGTLVHGPWVKRLPHARVRHRKTEFTNVMAGTQDAWLWNRTMRFFHIEEKGALV
ncbi:hypothetical protein ACVWZA_003973 [Sphingomonas sp. UYAg733]